MLTAVWRDQRWPDVVAGISARFSKFAFVLFCYKRNHLVTGPSNLNVSLDFVSENIEILGKQNSLLPSGQVIKCLLFLLGQVIECLIQQLPCSANSSFARSGHIIRNKLCWDANNAVGKIFFVLKVLLRYLRPSIIYSVPRDWIVQRAYLFHKRRQI